MARSRVSGQGVEVFYAPSGARAVVSQHGVEVWYTYAAASPTTVTGAGVSQLGVEVFYAPADAARVSQLGIEVFYAEPGDTDPGGGPPANTTHSFGYAC